MSVLLEASVVEKFDEVGVSLDEDSPFLERLLEIGRSWSLSAEDLSSEWQAFSMRNENCELEAEQLDKFEGNLETSSKLRSRASLAKTPASRRNGAPPTFLKEDLGQLFGSEIAGNSGEREEELMEAYGTPHDRKGLKRTNETTPTTPLPPAKARHQQNGTTPTSRHFASGSTPYRNMAENGMLSSTPTTTFHQRDNSRQVMCSLNDKLLPQKWSGSRTQLQVDHYNPHSALSSTYSFMYQKVSEKSLILLERIQEFGEAICHHNGLSSPLCISQPSLEAAIFIGKVACEGEGHLNASSCLLEGLSHARHQRGACVKLEIPPSLTCSLFPGQIIAVEGVNNYNGILTPSKIYHEGAFPPLPQREHPNIPGFTMLCAAGPFSTIDTLNFDPLRSLLEVVEEERPNALLLLGPFLDSLHPQVKDCAIPGDVSFQEFFKSSILDPISLATTKSRTKLILVPSQRDVHHPWMVYPQPPFQPPSKDLPTHSRQPPGFPENVFNAPNPATLSLSGICVGATSTDVLFHLSARTMFRGRTGDRMALVAKHILQQQCYYPLLPAFSKEEIPSKDKIQTPTGKEGAEAAATAQQLEEKAEVNLDLIHMFDKYGYAQLPVCPDILILPSNLKPFAKVVEGCVCINPGHLTKKTSGGTFAKISVPDLQQPKQDLSSQISAQIVHI